MAKPRAFLIHWKKEELPPKVRLLRLTGFTVSSEHEDGARAGKAIKTKPPHVIVIYLTRLPSHGRETARSLAEAKATRSIPIVFVDGEPDKVTQVRSVVPTAMYTTEPKLAAVLRSLL